MKLQLNEFLEKFLPEYEQKIKKSLDDAPSFWEDSQKVLWACYDIFPEALQNFANIICEKQRENCIASEWKVNSSILTIIKSIEKAKQPKIEEL